MRIGIDLDETFVHFIRGFCKFYNFKYGGQLTEEDFVTFSVADTLNVSKEESLRLRKEFYYSPLFDELEIVLGAKEAVEYLISHHEVFFITARSDFYKEKTKKFLENLFCDRVKLIFSEDYDGGKTKSEICNKLGILLLIEDYELSDNYAKEGIKVILIDKNWNRTISHNNLIRVKGWDDILTQINKLEAKI